MSADFQQGLLEVLNHARTWNMTHLANVVSFLHFEEDKFFLAEVTDLVAHTDDVATLANGFAQRSVPIMSRVPVEYQSSFVLALRLHQLQVVLRSLSSPQILALHRGMPEDATPQQKFQILTHLQRVLQAQPLSNLRNVHQMYRDEGPDCDKAALASMVGIGAEAFFVVEPVRQVLSLDAEEVKSLRESLSLFSAAHMNLLVDLLGLEDFGALEMRALFVDLMIEVPEGFLGGGFGLGLSGSDYPKAMEDDENDDDEDEYGDEWQSTIRLEITEQPPKACVYRRNVRPSPELHVKGIDSNNPRLKVAVVVVRCDTMAVLDVPTSLSGDLVYRVAAGSKVTFKKLKLLKTSNQLGDTHVALRFELRDYTAGGGEDDFQVLHSVQSIPFQVLSHSTQLKKPKELAPVVSDVIPPNGHVGGGTRLVLLGNNFMDTPGLRVRFDKTDVQPVYHGPRTLSCHAPPHHAPGPVSVRVCNDSTKFGDAAEMPFCYVVEHDPVWELQPGAAAGSPGGKKRDVLASPVIGRPNRVWFDLGRENLAGRNWTTDGSEFLFSMTNSEGPPSLSGSFDFQNGSE